MRREEKPAGFPLWLLILVLALFCCAALPRPALAKKTLPDHPIDINAATVKELEELPGVGPTTAKAIVLFRTRSGRFRRVEDLLAIRGISETKLKAMRPYVTLGPPPAAPQAKAAGAAPKTPAH
jgi:competence ComEA-like helix-hairpin-helix protein